MHARRPDYFSFHVVSSSAITTAVSERTKQLSSVWCKSLKHLHRLGKRPFLQSPLASRRLFQLSVAVVTPRADEFYQSPAHHLRGGFHGEAAQDLLIPVTFPSGCWMQSAVHLG